MRLVIQRVTEAQVVVNHQLIGQINRGLLIFLAIGQTDTENDLDYLVKKVTHLRIFPDQAQRMNLSVKDINGELLIIPQFTLLAETKKGYRPEFTKAAPPDRAAKLYRLFINKLKQTNVPVATGEFAADMEVSLTNSGPVTLIIDSK